MVKSFFFFFNDTATTEIYTLSLHDALPIYAHPRPPGARADRPVHARRARRGGRARRGAHLARRLRRGRELGARPRDARDTRDTLRARLSARRRPRGESPERDRPEIGRAHV